MDVSENPRTLSLNGVKTVKLPILDVSGPSKFRFIYQTGDIPLIYFQHF